MKYALPASILAHVLVGTSGMVAFSTAPRGPVDAGVVVPIDIVSLAEMTELTEVIAPPPEPVEDDPEIEDPGTDEDAEEDIVDDVPEEDTQPADEDVPPPPSEEEATPEEDEPPAPTEDDTPEEAPADETPVVSENRGNESDDPLSDLFGDTEKLLRDKQSEPPSTRQNRGQGRELNNQSDRSRGQVGAGQENTSSVADFVSSYIQTSNKQCWRSVKDLPDWQRLNVTIVIRLDASGNLTAPPQRTKPAFIARNDIYLQRAADRAMRAVNLCAPYPLNPSEYDQWRNQDIVLNFGETP